MNQFEDFITNIPDFPQKGVTFKDVSPLLKFKFSEVISELEKQIDWTGVQYVAGIESRGFILASALAAKKSLGFVPIRKKGKLPPPTISESYGLEYGSDTLEIHPSKEKGPLVILDDVLATGGTLKASLSLCKKAGYDVQDIAVLINLKFLNRLDEEGIKVKSLLTY